MEHTLIIQATYPGDIGWSGGICLPHLGEMQLVLAVVCRIIAAVPVPATGVPHFEFVHSHGKESRRPEGTLLLGTMKTHGATVFFTRHSDGQTTQQQSWANTMLGDNDLGIIA